MELNWTIVQLNCNVFILYTSQKNKQPGIMIVKKETWMLQILISNMIVFMSINGFQTIFWALNKC